MSAARAQARLPRWLYPIRVRFLAVHLLLAAVPVAGIGFARFYEREMLRSLEQDMIHQGSVVAEFLRADPAGARLHEREALLRSIARGTRTRIRLLDTGGRLAADSHRDGAPEGLEPSPPELIPARLLSPVTRLDSVRRQLARDELLELGNRDEVQAALAGRYGSATRLYENGNKLFLFSALPLRDASGARIGVAYLTRSTNPVRAAMYRIRASLLQIFAIAFGVTLVISLFLAATISRPLARLTESATAIANGDRGRSLQVDRHDEIGRLASAFSLMRERLDERAQQTAQLAANISHEFKSPLTSLRGAAELLLDGAADDPAARERFLRNMLADTQRLDRLVTRLLELSRVEADSSPDEALDLEALVRDTCAQRHEANVEIRWEARARRVRGRRPHLASAVGNLVDNALQHAAPGTTVRVSVVDAAPGRVLIEVHNHGVPISPANLPRVWDRFFTTRAERGGSGLGLPIVAAVARAHGGSVGVESSAAEGTRFHLELPAEA